MTGLGAAMAGGNPTRGRQFDDYYPTPPEVTRALLTVETFDGTIWEPACGCGAMARELVRSGAQVISSDIAPRNHSGFQLDFFSLGVDQAHVGGIDHIVTNPPFELAERFILHAHRLAPRKIAFVLKSTYWHAANRLALFRRHQPARIYPLTWRPDFLSLGRPTMEVAWVVWDREHVGDTLYRPLAKPRALAR